MPSPGMPYFDLLNPGEHDGNCEKTGRQSGRSGKETGFGQQGSHCCGPCRCSRKRQAAGSGQEGCCGTCEKGSCQCQQTGGESRCCSRTGQEICRTGQESRCTCSCCCSSSGCQKGRSGSGQKGGFCTRGKVGRRQDACGNYRSCSCQTGRSCQEGSSCR